VSAIRLILHRVVAAVPVLLVVASMTFFAVRAVPGGPWDREKALPEAVLANLEARADLDQPLSVQYIRWLGRTATGDLDVSMKYPNQTVAGIIGRAFPVSLTLGGLAALFALTGGVGLGVLTALRPGSWIDRVGDVLTTLGFSLPSFVLGSVLVLAFALGLGWFPAALWTSPLHVVLPALTLAVGPAAYVARLTRGGLIEALAEPWVRTARARGLPEWRVVIQHGLRNALGPIVTVTGPLVAWMITGSFVVEQIFAIPGLGRYFVTAVIDRDYSLLMGVTLFFAVVVIAANTVVDLLYAWVDPRVRGGR
jgi:oligopeptide transport system permease protein